MNDSGIKIEKLDNGSIQVTIKDLGIASKVDGKSHTIFCPALKVLGYSTRSKRQALKDFEKNLKRVILLA